MEGVDIFERVEAEGLRGAVVADVADNAARDGLGVDGLPALAGDFPQVDHEIGAYGRLAGDMGARILPDAGVENGVGNLVGDFVGVAFGDGFGGEDVAGLQAAHCRDSLLRIMLIVYHDLRTGVFFR